jgi:hypothetical protein
MSNPYRGNAARTFWRSAVAEKHIADFSDMWDPLPLKRSDRVATAGSCFAQHIGHNLKIRGADYMNMEPAPPIFANDAEARRFGFGVFSCRYGNIYTSRQLLQLIEEAFEHRRPAEVVWEKDGRFFDALRPGIDPVGEASAEDVLTARATHLAAVRKMFESLDLLVFTMGLTEGWENIADKTMFPTAPGTIAGSYDPARYRFHNLRHAEILADMQSFWQRLKAVNPGARMLLTISPVPLVATATGGHVLSATTYSKSVLRGVAGDMAEDHADIHYFPSYEIISGHPSRGIFFNPDLRNVNEFGVNLVMTHFFSGALAKEFGIAQTEATDEIDLVCDESRIADGL